MHYSAAVYLSDLLAIVFYGGTPRNIPRFIIDYSYELKSAPVKLLGYKRLKYLLWLKQLRTIPRYTNKINIPDTY